MTIQERLLSVSEARERIVQSVPVLGSEPVPVVEALGRVLAERVVAAEPVPPFANSGMDGYAVRAADVSGASREHPALLRVTADIPVPKVSTHARHVRDDIAGAVGRHGVKVDEVGVFHKGQAIVARRRA